MHLKAVWAFALETGNLTLCDLDPLLKKYNISAKMTDVLVHGTPFFFIVSLHTTKKPQKAQRAFLIYLQRLSHIFMHTDVGVIRKEHVYFSYANTGVLFRKDTENEMDSYALVCAGSL